MHVTGFVTNIERDTISNDDFRRVLFDRYTIEVLAPPTTR